MPKLNLDGMETLIKSKRQLHMLQNASSTQEGRALAQETAHFEAPQKSARLSTRRYEPYQNLQYSELTGRSAFKEEAAADCCKNGDEV